MSAPNFVPALSLFTALAAPPFRPLHTLVRTTEERFRPARLSVYRPSPGTAPDQPDEAGSDVPRASILCERGVGRVPTIVLGGLVPDATEQVFLLRRFLLKNGDVYYVNYPRTGFVLDVLCDQLGALVDELCTAGMPPVLFAVSFGAGVVLEWLRRARARGHSPVLGGIVLVSPVSCVSDLVAPGAAKPSTLLGRALKPYLDATAPVAEATVEKSRSLFVRMFEAGAQNKQALRLLMTKAEAERLRTGVMDTIRGVTSDGARARARALASMVAPTDYFTPRLLPLTDAPALVLFAEREEAVLDEAAPVRLAFERALPAYFPRGAVRRIMAKKADAPVQHASLVFHVFEFLPPLQAFYQRLRREALAVAA